MLTARQPGARFAPLHFLSGGLFSNDIHLIHEADEQARPPIEVPTQQRGRAGKTVPDDAFTLEKAECPSRQSWHDGHFSVGTEGCARVRVDYRVPGCLLVRIQSLFCRVRLPHVG